MKKILTLVMVGVLALGLFAACGAPAEESPSASASESQSASASSSESASDSAAAMEGAITVVSREDGSGTRSAFIELVGVEQEDEEGNTQDMTTEEASVVNSTSVVMTTVEGDPNAIGYISLGSLNDTVKALEIDGVAPTVETVKDGSYKVSRPFNIATNGAPSAEAQDFIDFILSQEGQAVVEEEGYISVEESPEAFAGGDVSGKITIAGSSSVTPVMEKLKEAYNAVNPDLEIEISQSDSTTGMNSAMEGICDIGMASRELKDSETSAGLEPIVIAQDGIAVIVNNENPTTGLTMDQLKQIYTGEVTDWSEIA